MSETRWTRLASYPDLLSELLKFFIVTQVTPSEVERKWRSLLEHIGKDGSQRVASRASDIIRALGEEYAVRMDVGTSWSAWTTSRSDRALFSRYLETLGDYYARAGSTMRAAGLYAQACGLSKENVQAATYLVAVLKKDSEKSYYDGKLLTTIADQASDAASREPVSGEASAGDLNVVLAELFEKKGKWGPAVGQWKQALAARSRVSNGGGDYRAVQARLAAAEKRTQVMSASRPPIATGVLWIALGVIVAAWLAAVAIWFLVLSRLEPRRVVVAAARGLASEPAEGDIAEAQDSAGLADEANDVFRVHEGILQIKLHEQGSLTIPLIELRDIRAIHEPYSRRGIVVRYGKTRRSAAYKVVRIHDAQEDELDGLVKRIRREALEHGAGERSAKPHARGDG